MERRSSPYLVPPPYPAFPEQDENGVDLSLIIENLRLSPSERLVRGDQARRNALVLLEYARRNRKKKRKP